MSSPARIKIPRPALEIDYDIYADGEALLGWLNATLLLETDDEVEGGSGPGSATPPTSSGSSSRKTRKWPISKMTLTPDHGLNGEVAVINLVRNDFRPEFGQELEEPVTGAQIILNLRPRPIPNGWQRSSRRRSWSLFRRAAG